VPERAPADVSVRQLGSVPAVNFQVYGDMPPETASVSENAVPTVAGGSEEVVIEGAAGTVIVMVAVLDVSATEVAVIVAVKEEAEGAGAVYVTEVLEVFDSVPPPLTVQVTPSLPWSWSTAAVMVMESVGSTVADDAVRVMLIGFELPPQPVIQIEALVAKQRERQTRASFFQDIMRPQK
jgi:hypothetical protein